MKTGGMPEKSRETHSVQSLRNAVERLRALLIPAERIADEMEIRDIQSLEIDYQAALRRAMDDLARWGRACEMAFTDEMHRRGAFRASDEGVARQKKKKPPKVAD